VANSDDDALRAHAKRQLRQRMRALRGALPPNAHRARSEKVVAQIIQSTEFGRATRVGLFRPMPAKHEIDLGAIDTRARELGKIVYYPFMDKTGDGFRTGFRRVDDPAGLSDRGRGFDEPGSDLPEAKPRELELIVVPALAVGADGHRLGYGVGFYDVTLPEQCPPAIAIAVAFSFQLCADLPHDAHDFRCDIVVTDETWIQVAG
jgi:5-formyltetrahydrofolate cyclo-ligase